MVSLLGLIGQITRSMHHDFGPTREPDSELSWHQVVANGFLIFTKRAFEINFAPSHPHGYWSGIVVQRNRVSLRVDLAYTRDGRPSPANRWASIALLALMLSGDGWPLLPFNLRGQAWQVSALNPARSPRRHLTSEPLVKWHACCCPCPLPKCLCTNVTNINN